jgi:hypothetical protein
MAVPHHELKWIDPDFWCRETRMHLDMEASFDPDCQLLRQSSSIDGAVTYRAPFDPVYSACG